MRGRTSLMVLGVLALSACDGGGESSSSQLWCNGLCMAVQRCGYADPNCRADCVAQRPGLESYSTSGASAQEPCLAGLSCQALSDDATWKTEVEACWKKAQMSVEITPPVRDFCAGYALAWFDCGYTLPIDECEHIYAMWKDSVLDRLATCEADTSCDAFRACDTAVFDTL